MLRRLVFRSVVPRCARVPARLSRERPRRYCDGGSFSGNNDTVQPYKGATLHWRGKRIREAAYAELLANHGLKDATDAVISGCSAGGLATFLHTDQWCDALAEDAKGIKCVGMPDSGFFRECPLLESSPPQLSSEVDVARSQLTTRRRTSRRRLRRRPPPPPPTRAACSTRCRVTITPGSNGASRRSMRRRV